MWFSTASRGLTRVLGWLAALGLVAGLVLALGVAPREVSQGNVQRIMYLHVPSILTAYLAFAIVFVASFGYLVSRRQAWDRWAGSAAELGTLFTGLTLASGSLWGKPTWGTWWTWDARLTSTAVMFVTYVAYLMLRGMIDEAERRAQFAAVLGIVAALNLPLVHFSVLWWRTLHQPPTLLRPVPAALAGIFRLTLGVNWLAFTLLFAYLLAKRIRVGRLSEADLP
jgi:heme exporter protein C